MQKKYAAVIVSLSISALFIPVFAHAAWWNPLSWGGDIAQKLAGFLVQLVATAIIAIPAFIFFIVANITNWLIETVFNIGVVPNAVGTPTFVEAGFNFTLSLVNILFLVMLAFIGLATILRLREYELQRTLPKLIIIALLVNFSALLVGFVVDIGNILTVFFTQSIAHLDGAGFLEAWNLAKEYLKTLNDSSNADLVDIFVGGLTFGIVTAIFFTIATIIYFAIAIIFFLRLIILWVLVILAPIAFAARILPGTQRWWNQWFSALIQWAFVGVPIGFFMFLANNVLLMSEDIFPTEPAISGTVSWASGLIGSMLAPFVALVLLFLGISISLSLAPTLARRAAFGGLAAGAAVGLGAGYLLWRNNARAIEQFGDNLRKRGQGLQVKEEEKTKLERFTGSTIGKVPGMDRVGQSKIAKFAARNTGGLMANSSRKLSATVGTQDDQQVARAQQEAGRMQNVGDVINQMNLDLDPKNIHRVGSMNRAIGRVKELIENRDPADLEAAFASGQLNPNVLRKLYKGASERRNPRYKRMLEKAFISRHGDMGVSEKDSDGIWKFITPQDFHNNVIDMDNFDVKTQRGKDATDQLLEKGDPDNLPAMVQAFRQPERRRAFRDHLEEKGNVQWYVDNDLEHVPLYFASQRAENEGLAPLHGETRDDVRGRIRERNNNKTTPQLRQELGTLEAEEEQLRQEFDTLTQEEDVLRNSGQWDPSQERPITITQRKRYLQNELNRKTREHAQQKERINAELTLRSRPDADIEAEITSTNNDIATIDALDQDTVTPDQFKERATKAKQAQTLQAERSRRKRQQEQAQKQDTGFLGTPEKASVGERMANIEKRINKLQENARLSGTQSTREEQSEITKLQKEFDDLEKTLQNPNETLLSVRNIERDLYRTQKDMLATQDRIAEINTQIDIEKQTTNNKGRLDQLNQDLASTQSTLGQLEKQKSGQLEERAKNRAVRGAFTPEGLAERIARFELEEQKFANQAAKLRIAGNDPKRIQEEEEKAERARVQKEHSTRKLVALTQRQELETTNTKLLTQDADLQTEIARINTVLPSLTTTKEVDRQRKELLRVQQQQRQAQTKLTENRNTVAQIIRMEGDPFAFPNPDAPGVLRSGLADKDYTSLSNRDKQAVDAYKELAARWQKANPGKQVKRLAQQQQKRIKIKPPVGEDE